jgi:hypothetical protein
MSSSADSTPTPAPQDGPSGSGAQPHPVLIYTTWRIAIFIVTLVVLYFVGLRDVWLLVLAFLISGVISIFVLDRRRQQAVGGFSSLFRRMNDRIDASTRAEDDDYVGGPQEPAAPSAEDDQTRAE